MCLPFLAAIPAAIGSAASAIGSAVSGIGIGTAASLVGTGLSAIGSIQQGNAAKAQSDAQAKAYQNQASYEMQAGDYQAARKKDEIDQTQGQLVAQTGGSGFTLAGSPSDVSGTIASQGQLDMDVIKMNALGRAQNLNYQATVTRAAGKQAQTAGYIGAFSNALGGLSNVYNDYQRVKLTRGGPYQQRVPG